MQWSKDCIQNLNDMYKSSTKKNKKNDMYKYLILHTCNIEVVIFKFVELFEPF